MASISQPIACQPAHPRHPQNHPSDAYSAANNTIPASYYLGSPISWKASSFGSRFYPGCSPGQLLGPLDPSDFRCGKMSSSLESDCGSILNALSAFDREGELCRNYTCCGLQIEDLHGLVQHFEDVHVVVVDQFGQPQQRFPTVVAPHYQHPSQAHVQPPQQPLRLLPPSYPQGGFDPDDMELDVDQSSSPSMGGPSPPDTPLTTPLSSHPFPRLGQSGTEGPPPQPPISAFDTTTVPTRSLHTPSITPFPPSRGSPVTKPEPFNGYAGYSDYSSSMPGAVPSPSASEEHGQMPPATEPISPYGCLPPAVVFSTTATPVNTPTVSRGPSPTSSSRPPASPVRATNTTPTRSHSQMSPRASTTLSRPASSLLLSKPFRCPKPNCNKSYKQANGLKYHITHGSCNFAPPKDVEQVQALLASKRFARKAAGDDDAAISEGELREVEREAERRLRPFACGVGDCQRRYKNMNGLRYHYQHSGEHGAMGLGLLASGQHECLAHIRRDGSASVAGSTEGSRQASPLQSGPTTPTMMTAPSTPTTTAANMGLAGVSSPAPTYAQQYQQLMMLTSVQQHQYLRTPHTMHGSLGYTNEMDTGVAAV